MSLEDQEIIERIEEARDRKPCDYVISQAFLRTIPKDDRITYWRTGKLDVLRGPEYRPYFPKGDKFNPQKFESVAVVGNSGSLSDSGFGDQIDQHEAVWRFNTAPTRGYEEDVGSKATHRFSIGTLNFREKDEILLRSYRKKSQAAKDLRKSLKNDWLWVLTHHLSDWAQSFKDPDDHKVCSTGFLGVMMALSVGKRVSLYGFNLPTEGKNFPYHYYNHSRYVERSHNFLREHEIYEMLNKKVDYFQWIKND